VGAAALCYLRRKPAMPAHVPCPAQWVLRARLRITRRCAAGPASAGLQQAPSISQTCGVLICSGFEFSHICTDVVLRGRATW